MNCSRSKKRIIKKQMVENVNTGASVLCDSTYSSKLNYMRTCTVAGSDCTTSFCYCSDGLERRDATARCSPAQSCCCAGQALSCPSMPDPTQPGPQPCRCPAPSSRVTRMETVAGEKGQTIPSGNRINYCRKLRASQ